MQLRLNYSKRNTLSLVELLVVIAGVICAILPTPGRAKEEAQRTGCIGNFRQLLMNPGNEINRRLNGQPKEALWL